MVKLKGKQTSWPYKICWEKMTCGTNVHIPRNLYLQTIWCTFLWTFWDNIISAYCQNQITILMRPTSMTKVILSCNKSITSIYLNVNFLLLNVIYVLQLQKLWSNSNDFYKETHSITKGAAPALLINILIIIIRLWQHDCIYCRHNLYLLNYFLNYSNRKSIE